MSIDQRTKFWITDPPAGYEDADQGVVFLFAFSSRRRLLDYYATLENTKQINRNAPFQIRWAKLVHYVQALGWQGINIDPDPDGGPSTLVLLDAQGAQVKTGPDLPTPTLKLS